MRAEKSGRQCLPCSSYRNDQWDLRVINRLVQYANRRRKKSSYKIASFRASERFIVKISSPNKTLLHNITQSSHTKFQYKPNHQIVLITLCPLPCAHCLRFTEHLLYVDDNRYSDEPQPLAWILNEVYNGSGQIFLQI